MLILKQIPRLGRFLGLLGIASLFGLAAPQSTQAEAGTYGFDVGHSEVIFTYSHAGMTTQYGVFANYDGTLVFDPDKPEDSQLTVTIKADSVETNVPALNKDLMSDRFFDVAKNPEITFVSTGIQKTGVKTGQVTGDLTIKGVTKPVTLDVTFNFIGVHPLSPYLEYYKDAEFVAFSAKTSVLRSEFGLGFGAPITGDQIDIIIETEMRKQ